MPIFYNPNITKELQLDGEESRHCIKVLRKNIGDNVQVTDGQGGLHEYVIEDANPKKCKLSLVKQLKQLDKIDFNVHIAIAPPKNNDRLEWFVEKATELGVNEISLVLTTNSERRISKIDRLTKKSIAALKQSGNLFLPRINELLPLEQFIEENNDKKDEKYVAYVPTDKTALLFHQAGKGKKYTVLIGPEGDFTEAEIKLLNAKSYQCTSLGQYVQRTETAGLTALHQLVLLNY